MLVLHVSDVKDRPIAGVKIATEGDGATGPPTDAAGKTRIRLAVQTRPGARVTLQIVGAPATRDLVFISPWSRTTQVPPFENESNNYVPTVLADRADQELLKNPAALKAITASINQANAPQAVTGGARAETDEEHRQRVLSEVARQAAAQAQEKAADAAFFWGQSLYEQGRYREAVTAYQEVYIRRPDDARTLNALGLSLLATAAYAKAEPLFRRARAIREKTLGPDHPDVATSLNNLAGLLQAKGDYAGAEPPFRRALAISLHRVLFDLCVRSCDTSHLRNLHRRLAGAAGALTGVRLPRNLGVSSGSSGSRGVPSRKRPISSAFLGTAHSCAERWR